MRVPKWLEGVLVTVKDVGTAFVGSVWAHGREEVAKAAIRALMPDREDVLKDLNRYAPETRFIRRLLKRANVLHGGIITVNLPNGRRMRRTENWVINRILQVEPKDRQWLLARWNRLCEENPAAFLAELSLLENNWYLQYPRLIFGDTKDALARLDHSLGPVADWLESLAGGG